MTPEEVRLACPDDASEFLTQRKLINGDKRIIGPTWLGVAVDASEDVRLPEAERESECEGGVLPTREGDAGSTQPAPAKNTHTQKLIDCFT
jgi:hypothetical protein